MRTSLSWRWTFTQAAVVVLLLLEGQPGRAQTEGVIGERDEWLLEYRFETGEVFTYQLEEKGSTEQAFGKAPVTSSNHLRRSTLSFSILRADESGYEVEMVTERLSTTEESEFGTISIDSERPEDLERWGGTPFGLMLHLVGHTMQLRVGARGGVTDVSGIEEFIRKMGERYDYLKMLSDVQGTDWMKEISVKTTASEVFPPLPREPVGLGDTWDKEEAISVPYLGQVLIVHRYTLSSVTEVEGELVAEITYEGKLASAEKETPTDTGADDEGPAPVDFSVDMGDSGSTGTIRFSLARGCVLEGTSNSCTRLDTHFSREGQETSLNIRTEDSRQIHLRKPESE